MEGIDTRSDAANSGHGGGYYQRDTYRKIEEDVMTWYDWFIGLVFCFILVMVGFVWRDLLANDPPQEEEPWLHITCKHVELTMPVEDITTSINVNCTS